jgi:hypothetical protein
MTILALHQKMKNDADALHRGMQDKQHRHTIECQQIENLKENAISEMKLINE